MITTKTCGQPRMSVALLPVMLAVCVTGLGVSTSAAQSFDCAKASNQAEKMICADAELKKLDLKMADLYKRVLAKSSAKDRQNLKSEQVGWLKNRNNCAKIENPKACIGEFYTQRISYLEPIAGGTSPDSTEVTDKVTFSCQAGPELVASFMGPEKVRIEVGDRVLTLPRVKSGSGAKYANKEATFWTQGDGAQFNYLSKSYNCQAKK